MDRFANTSWYVQFNLLEGILWICVAVILALRCPAPTTQRRWAVYLGAWALVIFGLTDFLECRYEGCIPLWLWGLKIACGAVLLVARYTWQGWHAVHFPNREMWFALFCLACVLGLIWLQIALN